MWLKTRGPPLWWQVTSNEESLLFTSRLPGLPLDQALLPLPTHRQALCANLQPTLLPKAGLTAHSGSKRACLASLLPELGHLLGPGLSPSTSLPPNGGADSTLHGPILPDWQSQKFLGHPLSLLLPGGTTF